MISVVLVVLSPFVFSALGATQVRTTTRLMNVALYLFGEYCYLVAAVWRFIVIRISEELH